MGLQDLHQRLGVVAVGREPRGVEHPPDLGRQQRRLPRALPVGGAGVQPEESPLPDHLAVGVEPLDADVVEVGVAVHRRARVRLGQHQRRRAPGRARWPPAPSRWRAARGVPRRIPRPVAARARARRSPDPRRQQLVLAVAEEREVIVRQPAQERGASTRSSAPSRGRPPARRCTRAPRLASAASPRPPGHLRQRLLDARAAPPAAAVGLALDSTCITDSPRASGSVGVAIDDRHTGWS